MLVVKSSFPFFLIVAVEEEWRMGKRRDYSFLKTKKIFHVRFYLKGAGWDGDIFFRINEEKKSNGIGRMDFVSHIKTMIGTKGLAENTINRI